ncbi:hypothetical protein DM02DRAFT_240440 [Periconia macrospinosa]|uniref:Uncharacterized protein n=1 Tax=Periconia macrospinosa TaxID=97972 RepID=A0A2V1E1T6_9PLEO|nr:hypothetical protein DM02DRAFT_240440 [Periconia macrospinosa]
MQPDKSEPNPGCVSDPFLVNMVCNGRRRHTSDGQSRHQTHSPSLSLSTRANRHPSIYRIPRPILAPSDSYHLPSFRFRRIPVPPRRCLLAALVRHPRLSAASLFNLPLLPT